MWRQYRDKLRVLARTEVPAHLRAKLDSEDLVQIALMRIHKANATFGNRSEPELHAYLRQTLASAVTHVIRGYDRGKRRAERECSLEIAFEQPDSRRAACLAADQTSPSAHARRNEQSRHLAAALEGLPETQRRAIELHYFQRRSIGETAELLGISYAAVAGLLRRGLERLRERLVESLD